MAKHTLWDFYANKGMPLPSVQERKEQFNLPSSYRGTAEQNTALLGRLQGGGQAQARQPAPSYSPTSQAPAQRTQEPVALIQKHFPRSQWEMAYAVMMAETGGRNIPSEFNRYGGENSHGLFQINLNAHPQMRGRAYDPEENVKFAAQLWEKEGWRPWGAFTRGGYKQHLSEARNVMAGEVPVWGEPTERQPEVPTIRGFQEASARAREPLFPRIPSPPPPPRRTPLRGMENEPIYDDLGRIVGFPGQPDFQEPADRTEQSIARNVAGRVDYMPPLFVKPSEGYKEVLRSTLFTLPPPIEPPNPEEERKKQALIEYYRRRQR